MNQQVNSDSRTERLVPSTTLGSGGDSVVPQRFVSTTGVAADSIVPVELSSRTEPQNGGVASGSSGILRTA